MTTSAKKTFVYAGLAFLTVWPGVQIWLSKSYGVSPWKLGGWGMYAAPRPKYVGMEILYRAAGAGDFTQLTSPSAADRDAANEFLERYRWLGKLAFPEEFAATMLRLHPEWSAVRVVLSQPVLDKHSAMMVMQEEIYERSLE